MPEVLGDVARREARLIHTINALQDFELMPDLMFRIEASGTEPPRLITHQYTTPLSALAQFERTYGGATEPASTIETATS